MLLNDMANILRDGGSVVEEVAGWVGWNHGALTQVDCIVIHHTATPATAVGDYPSLNIVRNGRSDLAGPLAQLGAGRSGKIYVISNGVAWHAGTTLQAWMDNYHAIGIEVESPGTGVQWPDAQVQSVARAVASLCKRYNVPTSRVLGHKEICAPVGRKIDPVGIPGDMPAFRALVQQYISGQGVAKIEEDDWMASIRLAKWSGAPDVFVVTPMGHWRLPNMQAADDFAFKYGLPQDGNGHAVIETNDRTDWFGPNLSVVVNNVAQAAADAKRAADQTAPSA